MCTTEVYVGSSDAARSDIEMGSVVCRAFFSRPPLDSQPYEFTAEYYHNKVYGR